MINSNQILLVIKHLHVYESSFRDSKCFRYSLRRPWAYLEGRQADITHTTHIHHAQSIQINTHTNTEIITHMQTHVGTHTRRHAHTHTHNEAHSR